MMKIEQLSVYIYRWVGTTCMYTFLHSCALISLSIYMYLSVDIHEGYLCILPVLELMCDECILCFEWKVYCMEIASAVQHVSVINWKSTFGYQTTEFIWLEGCGGWKTHIDLRSLFFHCEGFSRGTSKFHFRDLVADKKQSRTTSTKGMISLV